MQSDLNCTKWSESVFYGAKLVNIFLIHHLYCIKKSLINAIF